MEKSRGKTESPDFRMLRPFHGQDQDLDFRMLATFSWSSPVRKSALAFFMVKSKTLT